MFLLLIQLIVVWREMMHIHTPLVFMSYCKVVK